jgi:general secretion pathway protein J
VTFVRSALGPNTRPGLEFVHIGETADSRGLAVVRSHAPFVPVSAAGLTGLSFADPVVLVRAPYRLSFSYAGAERVWQQNWRGAKELPTAIRVTVRDAATSQLLAISTAAFVHVDTPPACVKAKDQKDCDDTKNTVPAGQPDANH